MFDSIRNHKKYLMGFLLILLIPGFVLFGVQGFTDFNNRSQSVATVDGQEITQMEWDEAHQVESQRRRAAMPSVDPKLLDSDGARYATLQRMVAERVLAAASRDQHLYTSDQRLAKALRSEEAIASLYRTDGSLDIEAYKRLLASQGLSPAAFEARVRYNVTNEQVTKAVERSGIAPAALANLSLNAFFERREVRVQRFLATEYAAKVQPTDAEIESFYKDNPALFQAPEQVDVEYLVLDSAALAQVVNLSEQDLRAYYEQNASRLSGNEERRASHILLALPQGAPAAEKEKLRQRAQELLDQVRKSPTSFAEVAKANSQDPGSASKGGDLDFFGRGAMVKPFEDAVFSMSKGAISDVVESEFGFHIIQLTDIKAPKTRSFEEMRPEIEASLKKQQAQKQFSDSAEAFGNLVYEQADSLQPAAERLKLQIRTAKALTRKGVADAGVLGNERLLAAIFSPDSVEKKRNTAAVETASGQLAAARVLQHMPARTQPLVEVREQVRARLVAQRALELARKDGEQKLVAWKGGADASGMAPVVVVSRDKPQSFPLALLDAAMGTDAKVLPAWRGVDLGQQGYAVIRVDKVLPREAPDAAMLGQEVQQYGAWWSAAESLAYLDALKDRYKVKVSIPEPKPTQ